jgi:transketolase
LRSLPNMTVISPADAHEVRGALRAALRHDGPVYIRIGKKGEPLVHDQEPEFSIGQAIVIRPGRRVAFLANGTVVKVALDAADRLGRLGLSPEVVSFHTVKPLDQATLTRVFDQFDLVVTVEEHSVVGGLGGSVAEWLADTEPRRARLLRVGTPDTFLHQAGEQEHAREVFGLTPEHIAERVRARLIGALPVAA